jgi:hypothetical protein
MTTFYKLKKKFLATKIKNPPIQTSWIQGVQKVLFSGSSNQTTEYLIFLCWENF